MTDQFAAISAAQAECRTADEHLSAARRRLGQAVSDAVIAGVSWQQIGDHFGISRQAAWERFHSAYTRGG